MNQIINMEVRFFLVSVLCGAFLLVAYDILRIFRRVVEHGTVWISIEDILYWMVGAVLIFRMMYKMNNGIIRWFSLIGILLGMIIYKYSISDYIVKGISFLLIKIKKFIRKLIHILTGPVRFVLQKIQKLFEYIGKKVKKRIGIITCFVQNRARKRWKSLQTKAESVRIKRKEQVLAKKQKKEERANVKKRKEEKKKSQLTNASS